jgi:hypothetical protein
MQLFARFEANCLAGSNADLGSGARIAADAGFTWTNVEDPKAAQLDPLSVRQCLFEGLENGIDRGLSLIALQPRSLNHLMNDVLFYQGFPPSRELPDLVVIVETFSDIVNGPRLP